MIRFGRIVTRPVRGWELTMIVGPRRDLTDQCEMILGALNIYLMWGVSDRPAFRGQLPGQRLFLFDIWSDFLEIDQRAAERSVRGHMEARS